MLTLSGSILFGFTTAQNLIFNGILLALIIRMALLSGVSLGDILILVLPHAIFEIPAIIAGAAVLNPVRNNQIFSWKERANTDKRRHQRILNLSINLHSANHNSSICRSLYNTKNCRTLFKMNE